MESDIFGKLIILSLLALSIVCWALLIHKIQLTRSVAQVSKAFEQAFFQNRDQFLRMDLAALPKAKNPRTPHPFARIFEALKAKTLEIFDKNLYFLKEGGKERGVTLSPADLDSIESHTLTIISAQAKLLDKNLFILATIATLGPFLGLLGTVWGILITFSELHAGASASTNAAALGGLSMALATTVLGLLIAIPALIAHNYLKNVIKNYTSDMEDFLYQLLSAVELQYRKVEM
ncbi:MAG: MotA/TolQ/ExbB proton channel family protein [Verrucomicrobia bacterium]|nr:MotA/TolQ/ExbB proton channel family protein [Verrucomicrobiota bacterium]